ncbi:unnamed protein product [Allacma fusca]|uniref:Uncharacterized protein n=1 Tax=Allacma fusca TaxID=39272 RepID=A0A8J2KET0_9HEXA|nr:unnamed protein product [Allacma fusca]
MVVRVSYLGKVNDVRIKSTGGSCSWSTDEMTDGSNQVVLGTMMDDVMGEELTDFAFTKCSANRTTEHCITVLDESSSIIVTIMILGKCTR